MENRMISLERNTNETQIDLTLDLDGSGRYEIDTGCGFLNHMLELFARHGRFDLVLTCHGDVEVDYHHTTEDVGIALGQAFARALGDMRGIQRYGSFHLPMDEALILCAVDLSGRCTLNYKSPSNTSCQGSPCLFSCSINGSGLNSSTLFTPGRFHSPLKNIMAPIMAGTPVV